MAQDVDVLDTPAAGALVVRGGILRVVGFTLGLLMSVGGVALLSRHLGVELYGRYQTVASLIMVVASVTDLGMGALGVREYVQRRGPERDALLRTLLGLRLALTTVGLVLAATIIAVGQDWGTGVVLGTGAMGLALMLLVFQTTLAIPLSAELRLGTIMAIDVTRQGLTAAGLALLVVLDSGIFALLAVAIPVHALLVVWTARIVHGRVPLRPSFDLRAWGTLARASLAFALATAAGVIYQYVAQILTAFVADEETAGLFSASFRVYIIAAAIPGLLLTSAFPLLSRAAERPEEPRLGNAVRGLLVGTLILGCAGGLTCLLGAPAIVDIVYGSSFADAADALRIQGATLLLTFIVSTLGFTLLALHRHRPMIVVNLAALATTAVAVLVLAPVWDERGAALATVLGELVLACGYAITLTGRRPELRPAPASVGRVLIAAAGGAAAGLLLDAGAAPDAIAGLSVFAGLLFALKAIPPDVLALFPQRAR